MAAQPECRRCGDYVHSGLVVCEECSGILKDEMRALRTELADATAQIQRLNEENRRLLAELEAARDIVNYAHYINSQLSLHQHGWIGRKFSTAFLNVHKNLTRLFEKKDLNIPF